MLRRNLWLFCAFSVRQQAESAHAWLTPRRSDLTVVGKSRDSAPAIVPLNIGIYRIAGYFGGNNDCLKQLQLADISLAVTGA